MKFETSSLIEGFDVKVRQNYSEAMAAMDAFIDAFLDDGDLGEHLIRALLEVISQDKSIKNEDRFVIDCSNREVDKKTLLEMKQINARQFILGVWHFIILKRGDKNKLGQETVGVWLTHKTSQAPYNTETSNFTLIGTQLN
ncbi:MAG: hypothetical protein HUJ98_10850 [Bacteroidaceae bacterium]|nr:hypothetical protein [Bacteroidaceae bacterium]